MTSHLSERDEADLLAVSAPALFALLERRRETALKKLYSDYMAGDVDVRPAVAAWVALSDLTRDIQIKLNQRENLAP